MTGNPGGSGPLQPGQEFGLYKVEALIGRGGTAFVYRAVHTYLHRPVAIKVILQRPGRESASRLARRVQGEAVLLAGIDHPNVVELLDAGVTSEMFFLVMELLDGVSLRKALDHLGRFSVLEAIQLGIQICDGLAQAHSKEAVHRDVKPANVQILPGNRVKVLDFGIAKYMDSGDQTTQRDLWNGTPLYMAPEHISKNIVTTQSDIYATGVLLYEAMDGENPFNREKDGICDRQAICMAQIIEEPPFLCSKNPEIPEEVGRIIHRAMDKVPGRRYADVRALRDDLYQAGVNYCAALSAQGVAPTARDIPLHCPPFPVRAGAPEPRGPSLELGLVDRSGQLSAPLHRVPTSTAPIAPIVGPVGSELQLTGTPGVVRSRRKASVSTEPPPRQVAAITPEMAADKAPGAWGTVMERVRAAGVAKHSTLIAMAAGLVLSLLPIGALLAYRSPVTSPSALGDVAKGAASQAGEIASSKAAPTLANQPIAAPLPPAVLPVGVPAIAPSSAPTPRVEPVTVEPASPVEAPAAATSAALLTKPPAKPRVTVLAVPVRPPVQASPTRSFVFVDPADKARGTNGKTSPGKSAPRPIPSGADPTRRMQPLYRSAYE